ncbi:conserved Plasmodium protein, unknown function [Plasmodium sp. gorilla clade G3]|nr:conserved Plasmodium protein, unknown function [Plasmodium sp. gorilla clade G3]
MELSIETLKEKFLNMNSDIELIERKLKDEMGKLYEDNINPYYLLSDFDKIKKDLENIHKELDNLYIKKNMSINYLHRQMQNYNFLLNLEKNLNTPSRYFNKYHSSEILLKNYFYENIKRFLLNINYNEINNLIFLEYQQKYMDRQTPVQENINKMYDEHINSKSLNLNSSTGPIENSEMEKQDLYTNGVPNKNNMRNINNINNNEQDDLRNINEKENLFIPIDDATFQTVPLLIRRRAKLQDINMIYKTLYDMAIKSGNCLPVERSELMKMNLQVFGQTGEAKIATLRYLKIIEVLNKNASVRLLNCLGLKKKKKKKKTCIGK